MAAAAVGVEMSKDLNLAVWPCGYNLAANGYGCDEKKLK